MTWNRNWQQLNKSGLVAGCDEQGVFLHQYCAMKNEDVFDDWDNSYFHPDDLLEFLETHSLTNNVMLHTEYNALDFKV